MNNDVTLFLSFQAPGSGAFSINGHCERPPIDAVMSSSVRAELIGRPGRPAALSPGVTQHSSLREKVLT